MLSDKNFRSLILRAPGPRCYPPPQQVMDYKIQGQTKITCLTEDRKRYHGAAKPMHKNPGPEIDEVGPSTRQLQKNLSRNRKANNKANSRRCVYFVPTRDGLFRNRAGR